MMRNTEGPKRKRFETFHAIYGFTYAIGSNRQLLWASPEPQNIQPARVWDTSESSTPTRVLKPARR